MEKRVATQDQRLRRAVEVLWNSTLTEWELDFLESLRRQEKSQLTERQAAKLEDVVRRGVRSGRRAATRTYQDPPT